MFVSSLRVCACAVGVVQSARCDGQSVQVFGAAAGKHGDPSLPQQQQCAVYPGRLSVPPGPGSSTLRPPQYRDTSAGSSVSTVLTAAAAAAVVFRAATPASTADPITASVAGESFYFQDAAAAYRTTPAINAYYEKCAI